MGVTEADLTIYKKTTNEFRNLRGMLWEVKGKQCIYCGKPATELHHIIPRQMGGDNRFSNIVPLCDECHKKAHGKKHYKNTNKGRKPIKEPDNFNAVAELYKRKILSLEMALKYTGFKRMTFYRLLEKHGIKRKEGE